MRTRLAFVALACGVLSACGGNTVVDSAKLEKDIQSTISKNASGSVSVKAVDCPDDPPAGAGKTYTCSFDLDDGSSGEVTVNVRDDDGAARWDVSRPASGQAEQEISIGYEDETGTSVKAVECPDTLEPTTICTIELDDRATGKVTVTITNGGGIDWEVSQDHFGR